MRSGTYDIYGQQIIKDNFSTMGELWEQADLRVRKEDAAFLFVLQVLLLLHKSCNSGGLSAKSLSRSLLLWARQQSHMPGAQAFLSKRKELNIIKAPDKKAPQRSGLILDPLCKWFSSAQWSPRNRELILCKAVHFLFVQLHLLEKSCWLRIEFSLCVASSIHCCQFYYLGLY